MWREGGVLVRVGEVEGSMGIMLVLEGVEEEDIERNLRRVYR